MTAGPRGRQRTFQPSRFVLPNGLRVLLVEDHTLPAVALNLSVLAGARTDSEECAGTAVMASRLLDEGTRTRSSLEIADAIESVGGSIDCDSSHDRLTVYLSVLSKDLELGLELVADIISAPVFAEENVENERQRILAEIRSAMDRPQVIAGWEFNELVYRGHPLHRPVHGYPETVQKIQREHLVAFHQEHIVPGNAILSAAGDFDPDRMRDRIAGAFSRWEARPSRTGAGSPPIRQTEVRRRFLPVSSQQAHVYFGHLGIRRTDPDFYALQILDAVVGGGAGLTARIPRKLRDELGLAYTTFASITASAGVDPGKFLAYIGTSPENVGRSLEGFTAEIRRIIDEPVEAGELEDAKAYLTGSFVFGFESNAQIARFLTNAEIFGLGFDYVEQYPRFIEAITAEDVRRAAAAHLSTEHHSLVVAGPEQCRSAVEWPPSPSAEEA